MSSTNLLAQAVIDCYCGGGVRAIPESCVAACSDKSGSSGGSALFGTINPPPGVDQYASGGLAGFPLFINNILKLMIVGAGIFALFNLVTAGYLFMSAGDDPKKMADAWGKIWRSLMGLAFAAGSFVLAAIFGQLIFGNPDALLQFQLFTPGP